MALIRQRRAEEQASSTEMRMARLMRPADAANPPWRRSRQ